MTQVSRIYTIAPGLSFLDILAEGILARWGDDQLALARVRVYLPTRRACRALGEAFLRASDGRALVLPSLMPLGDLDDETLLLSDDGPTGPLAAELPPAIAPLKRRLLLTQLILAWAQRTSPLGEDQAARLADELARLIDQVETEGLDFARLKELVPEDYAAHWQTTLKFLAIVTERWPEVQRDLGVIGAAERRRLLLEAQAAAWRRAPPRDPVLVAGSTASIPATAALISVIAGLPQGMVVLPGLDQAADEATWQAIESDPGSPQHGMARLLGQLGVARDSVRDWAPAPDDRRAVFVNQALWPAPRTVAWHAQVDAQTHKATAAALNAVQRIDCPGPNEEALAIALLLRGHLNYPGQRAALVTPDRDLARRVAVELRRWDIEVDDSAGVPLADTEPGRFLRAVGEMVAENFAPLALLSALKHPLAALGEPAAACRARVRALELAVLHGPRPASGLPALRRALKRAKPSAQLIAWLDRLAERAAPMIKLMKRKSFALGPLVTAHLELAEALAESDRESGAQRLWAGEAGEQAAGFCAEMIAAATESFKLAGQRYPALFTGLMAGAVVRPHRGSHPRLAILGPLEARLQHVDLMILGGLNEGTWPSEVDPGPWLNRPMRADFGLPAPERRIGLAAHDFAQAFAAPRVVLTRATRIEGTPSVPSRWLMRIDALTRALGIDEKKLFEGEDWVDWANRLDQPEAVRPCLPPAPRPPLAVRPRRLSVTQVETWMRDPYGLYAAKILNLRSLEPLDADPGAAERGILVHKALERFVKRFPNELPPNPEAALLEIGRRVFREMAAGPGVEAFWWPRFCRIARWVAELERERRPALGVSWGEISGRLSLEAPGGRFQLSATADRIDRLEDGSLVILDYKTGAVPSGKAIDQGYAPQLPLEAAIAAAGGFGQDLDAVAPSRLEYWRLTGGEPPGEVKAISGDPAARAIDALAGLAALVAVFDDPETPYHAVPRPEWAPRYSDSAHLARIKEWAAGGERESPS
ncbi:MAG: double-strand break repair protein AddB [Pseudomonadota bacterium]